MLPPFPTLGLAAFCTSLPCVGGSFAFAVQAHHAGLLKKVINQTCLIHGSVCELTSAHRLMISILEYQ